MVLNELRDKNKERFYGSGIDGPDALLREEDEEILDEDRKMPAVEYGEKSQEDISNPKIQTVQSGK